MFFADDSAHIDTFRSLAKRGVCGLTGRSDTRISFVHVDDAAAAVVVALDAPPGIYNVAEPDPVTRGAHSKALATSVGHRRLRALPGPALRLGGAALDSVSRSQRISITSLAAATGWQPRIRIVDAWS
jgi:nucleoside-diphosphate-sugar epimerase